MKDNKTRCFLGIFTVTIITCFTTFFCFFNEPIGDDVLCYFQGALTYYLDEYAFNVGDKISNVYQVLNELKFVYSYWSGRMPGYALMYFGKLLPRIVQSAATAVLYSINVFLALRIIYRTSKKAISMPIQFCIIYLALYWVRMEAFYTYMWTMTSIYQLSVFLCLLYYNMAVVEEPKEISKHKIIIIQIIGFLAGFSHEVVALCMIATIGTKWLQDVVNKKRNFMTLFKHTGLGAGYLFCFFAPGNFYRAKQSHDIISTSYMERFINSVYTHLKMLGRTKEAFVLFSIVIALIIFIVVKLIKNGKKNVIKEVFKDNINFIVGGVVSIVIWAMTPRVPTYGLDLWIIYVYIVLFNFIRYFVLHNEVPKKYGLLNKYGVVIICLLFGVVNANELGTYINVSMERRTLVENAIESGKEEVIVPRFEKNLSRQRYLLDYLNNQEQYDREHYKKYYGIHIIIEDE